MAMKNTVKNSVKIVVFSVSFFLLVSGVPAQRLADVNEYGQSNTSYDTFRISGLSDSKMLVEVFNNYFSEQLAVTGESYDTGNDLYASRGVREMVDTWHVNEGAQIIGSFRSAGMGHTLNFLDADGDKVWSHEYPRNVYDKALGNDVITVDATGDYNFSLNTWSEYVRQETGETVREYSSVTRYGDDPSKNPYDVIQMVAFDVTDLVQLMFDDPTIESAYFFGWEDYYFTPNHSSMDFDYQDLVYLMVNVTPNTSSSMPEPATAVILGCAALFGAAFGRRKFRRES